MVDPPTIAVEPRDDGPDNIALELADQKQLALYAELATDYGSGLVSGRIVWKNLSPQRNDRRLVIFEEGPDSECVLRHD